MCRISKPNFHSLVLATTPFIVERHSSSSELIGKWFVGAAVSPEASGGNALHSDDIHRLCTMSAYDMAVFCARTQNGGDLGKHFKNFENQ